MVSKASESLSKDMDAAKDWISKKKTELEEKQKQSKEQVQEKKVQAQEEAAFVKNEVLVDALQEQPVEEEIIYARNE